MAKRRKHKRSSSKKHSKKKHHKKTSHKKAHRKAKHHVKRRHSKRRKHHSKKRKNPMSKTVIARERIVGKDGKVRSGIIAAKQVIGFDHPIPKYDKKSGKVKYVIGKKKYVKTPKERAAMKYALESVKEMSKRIKSRKIKKKLKPVLAKKAQELRKYGAQARALNKEVKMARESAKTGGYRVSVKTKYYSSKRSKSVKRKHKRKVKHSRNPVFGSPRAALNQIDAQFQKFTGHDLMEAGLLFGAGASLPVIEGLIAKIPGVSQVHAQLGKLGPQVSAMSSSLVTILVAGGAHIAINKVPQLGKLKKAEPVLRALIAASVVKAGSSMSQTVAKLVGMSGVTFTPSMRGVTFTPSMSGVTFTPGMSGAPQLGAPQLGSAPQLGYGADFGRYDVADYGGGAGYTEARKYSKADFGRLGECDEEDMESDDEPVLDQSSGVV